MPWRSWDLNLAARIRALTHPGHPTQVCILVLELLLEEATPGTQLSLLIPFSPQLLPLSGPLLPHPQPLETSQTHSHRSGLPFLRTSVVNKVRP